MGDKISVFQPPFHFANKLKLKVLSWAHGEMQMRAAGYEDDYILWNGYVLRRRMVSAACLLRWRML